MFDLAIPADLKVSGKHKAIKYDLNLVEIDETPWCKNLITGVGLDFLLGAASSQAMYFHGVAGAGNASPTLADTTLQSYLGKYSACQSITVERNYTTAPYYVKIATVHRYYPGAFGSSPVNINEFGMIFNTVAGNASITGSTQVASRALSVNGSGSPASVSVLPDEYLDHHWELTVWIPDSLIGAVSIAIDGTPVSHNYEARPASMGRPESGSINPVWFTPTFSQGLEPSTVGYCGLSRRPFPAITTGSGGDVNSSSWLSSGSLGVAEAPIGGTWASNLMANTIAAAAYSSGTYYRDYTYSWGLNNGNVSGGVSAAQLSLGCMIWKVSYSPAILKVAGKKLELTFRLSIANL